MHEWEWLWRLGEKLLAGMGIVAAAVTGVLYRRYQVDRGMLLHHEESIQGHDSELGHQKVFREQVSKGPIGESLMDALKELKESDRLLHKRISRTNDKQTELAKQVAEHIARVDTNIEWIRRYLENGDYSE